MDGRRKSRCSILVQNILKRYFCMDTELRLLRVVFDDLKARHERYEIFYIPHRDDSDNKLKGVEDIGFKLKPQSMPAELIFLDSSTLPEVVAGAFTSALVNLLKNISHSFTRFLSNTVKCNNGGQTAAC